MRLVIDKGEALDVIKLLFPRKMNQKNSALTGLIPIDFFDKHEARLRPLMRLAGLRAMYRGPRNYKYQSMTHRADATGVLIYHRC